MDKEPSFLYIYCKINILQEQQRVAGPKTGNNNLISFCKKKNGILETQITVDLRAMLLTLICLKKNIEIITCSKCLTDLGFKIILFFTVVNRQKLYIEFLYS